MKHGSRTDDQRQRGIRPHNGRTALQTKQAGGTVAKVGYFSDSPSRLKLGLYIVMT